ncbi:MAG: extracellular solute-binding protein [Proteobacteria bacterium]|nr:extracellular solute-binding protein [Pseudomonadota bacterium]
MNKIFVAVVLVAMTAPVFSKESAKELVVYSARNEQLIKPLFDVYTKETGTKIRFITDKAAPLLARLQAEGANSPADVLITVDAGNLWKAGQDGALARVESKLLGRNIPRHLRDPDNKWFGFSVRARTIAYSTERVKPGELSTYEALGSKSWKGRLCLRTSKKVYNQSLVAMMIARKGEAGAEKVVRSWVNNLAADVFSNDTAVLKAIAAGQCDAGIVNTYYYGRLMKKKPGLPIKLFWPNQKGQGVHVNVSGAGVVANSRNKAEATRFLEWLSTEPAQRIFADGNMEYPANPRVKPNSTVAAWGKFKQDRINVAKAGELQVQAVKLMDRAGYR